MERIDTLPARRYLEPIGKVSLPCICGIVLAFSWLSAPAAQTPAKAPHITTSHIAVGATVQPYAHLTATQPTQLIIANKDVNQGYVSVPNGSNPSGTQLTIKTNDHAGYTLVFQVAPAETGPVPVNPGLRPGDDGHTPGNRRQGDDALPRANGQFVPHVPLQLGQQAEGWHLRLATNDPEPTELIGGATQER